MLNAETERTRRKGREAILAYAVEVFESRGATAIHVNDAYSL